MRLCVRALPSPPPPHYSRQRTQHMDIHHGTHLLSTECVCVCVCGGCVSPRTSKYASTQQSPCALRVDPRTRTPPLSCEGGQDTINCKYAHVATRLVLRSNTHTHTHTQIYTYIYIYIAVSRFPCTLQSPCLPSPSSPSSKSERRRYRAPHEPLAISLSFECVCVCAWQFLSCFVREAGRSQLYHRGVPRLPLMKSLAKEFKELEATSQLPPSTPQQRLTPSTVFLPAAVSTVPPQLSPFVTSTAAALSPQASLPMCMAPVLDLSAFPRSPLHSGSTTFQSISDGYMDAHADHLGSRSCSVSNPFARSSPQTPAVALRIGNCSDVNVQPGTVHAHATPAARSTDADSAIGPLTSSSSSATTHLLQAMPKNSLMVSTTSAQPSNADEATSVTDTTDQASSSSWRSSLSDPRWDASRHRSASSPSSPAQARQQPRSACDTALGCVLTSASNPSGPSTQRVGCAAARGGHANHDTPRLPSLAEGTCALYPLTTVMEPKTSASATPPSDLPRVTPHERVKSGRPSTASKHDPPRQAPGRPQTPLSATIPTASATSRTKPLVQLSLQERLLVSAPLTPRSGRGTPTSTLHVAPSPSRLRSSSATKLSINAVASKPNYGKSRQSSTTAATAATAMTTAVTSSRLVPSPASSATATPPSAAAYMRLSSNSNGSNAHSHRNSKSMSSIPSTIAFLPIGVQPAIGSTSPSFFATSPHPSPSRAAVSASDSGTFIPGVAAASAPPTCDRGLSSASAVLATPSMPKTTALEQPGEASVDPRVSATPPLGRNPASPTVQPVQHPAYWSFPGVPAVSMAVFLAAPEVSWHSVTSGVTTPPPSSIGCGIRGTGTINVDGCSSTASIETPLATSPPSSAALDPQRTSGTRGTAWKSAGQTYRNVLVHGGSSTGGSSAGCATAVTASGSSYGLGLPLYSSQPQLLCTPVPLDDTESVCAICLEGRESNTGAMETQDMTALPSAPLPLPRATEEGASQESDSGAAVMNDVTPADDGAEHGAVRGVKPGSCLLSLPCGHCYHQNCVQRWLMESQSCPTCRRDLTRDATIN
ncbi:hypothetical protein, conserved [Leishmania tarentolae]|uniref:RING-type domain-containing protein n=1 Tax=Leishmania tarentolae TaxID=5689 RepID=A0A640KB07_LEITA|nr:hypothetical protein, conserved [Leishmania tarentolae]